MLLFKILLIIIYTALYSRKDISTSLARITLIVSTLLLYLLVINFYLAPLNNSISLYDGVFQFNTIAHTFNLFIVLLITLVITLTVFCHKNLIKRRDISTYIHFSNNKMGLNNPKISKNPSKQRKDFKYIENTDKLYTSLSYEKNIYNRCILIYNTIFLPMLSIKIDNSSGETIITIINNVDILGYIRSLIPRISIESFFRVNPNFRMPQFREHMTRFINFEPKTSTHTADYTHFLGAKHTFASQAVDPTVWDMLSHIFKLLINSGISLHIFMGFAAMLLTLLNNSNIIDIISNISFRITNGFYNSFSSLLNYLYVNYSVNFNVGAYMNNNVEIERPDSGHVYDIITQLRNEWNILSHMLQTYDYSIRPFRIIIHEPYNPNRINYEGIREQEQLIQNTFRRAISILARFRFNAVSGLGNSLDWPFYHFARARLESLVIDTHYYFTSQYIADEMLIIYILYYM